MSAASGRTILAVAADVRDPDAVAKAVANAGYDVTRLEGDRFGAYRMAGEFSGR